MTMVGGDRKLEVVEVSSQIVEWKVE